MKTVPLPRICLFLLCIIWSCGKDTCCDDPPTPEAFTAPGAQEFTDLLESTRDSLAVNISFPATEGLEYISRNGTTITIPSDCLITPEGDPLEGEVTLKFIELYDIGDMLFTAKPSIAWVSANLRTLIAGGGFFYLNLEYNGQSLRNSCEIRIQVPVSLTSDTPEDMLLWTGAENEENHFSWFPYTEGELFNENDYYIAYVSGNGWKGIAHTDTDAVSGITINVLATEGYNEQNASVYVAFEGRKHALAQLYFDEETSMFRTPEHQYFSDTDMHLLFVSPDNGQWRYAIKNVKAQTGKIYTVAHSETTRANRSALWSAIQQLP